MPSAGPIHQLHCRDEIHKTAIGSVALVNVEMAVSERRKWTEDELVQVLSLYCQIAFGQMHSRNPAVIEFAKHIGRTPSAVAMKLVNFASFDPDLQARGIRGMSNVSRLDREVWDAFHGQWTYLASLNASVNAAERHWMGRPTSAERTLAVRIGQGFFRNAVLSSYDGRCCITGMTGTALLRASHIIPWAVSEERRLDPSNGVCLNALHDAAFDRGLIAIDENLRVCVSRTTMDLMPAEIFANYFGCYDGRHIQAPERFAPDGASLRYHMEHVFIR